MLPNADHLTDDKRKARENALLRAVDQGDEEAFGELIMLYQGDLFARAYRILGNGADADDCLGTTWERAFKSRATWTDRGNGIKPWLMTIVQNVCRDMLDKRFGLRGAGMTFVPQAETSSYRPSHPLAYDTVRDGAIPTGVQTDESVPLKRLAANEADPATELLARERIQKATEALTLLGDECRLLISRIVRENLKYRQVAELMGLGIESVKKRYWRCMKEFNVLARRLIEKGDKANGSKEVR